MDNRVIAIDNRVIELAEKIYAENICYDESTIQMGEGGYLGLKDDDYTKFRDVSEGPECAKHRLKKQAEESITAAQVFYGVKKKMMMDVKEGKG